MREPKVDPCYITYMVVIVHTCFRIIVLDVASREEP